MVFLFANVTLDVVQVLSLMLILFCHFGGINCSGWMTSLTVFMRLDFLEGLDLRLTISRRRVMELSLIFVFISILSNDFVFIFLS